MADKHDIQEIYGVFNITRWHCGHPPKTTYCVVKFPEKLGGDVKLFVNNSNSHIHAEVIMIADLETRIFVLLLILC